MATSSSGLTARSVPYGDRPPGVLWGIDHLVSGRLLRLHTGLVLLNPRTLRYASAYALLLCVIAIIAFNTWPELWAQPLVLIALIPLVLTATAYPSLRHLFRVPGSARVEEGGRSSAHDLASSPQPSPVVEPQEDEMVGLLDSPARQVLFAATIATLVVVLALVAVVQPVLDRE
jgi:hypothetical protein